MDAKKFEEAIALFEEIRDFSDSAEQIENCKNGIMQPQYEEAMAPITATPEPTINPALIPSLRSIGDVMVWHTASGKWYHAQSTCGTMSNAHQYTLASSVRAGLTACPYCNPINQSALEIKNPVYVSDRDAFYHNASTCRKSPGVSMHPAHLSDVLKNGKTRCPVCNPPEPELLESVETP